MPPAGETIKDPGKKMPKSDSKKTEVRIIDPPSVITPPVSVNPIPVNAPAIVPAAPPAIEDNRNPF